MISATPASCAKAARGRRVLCERAAKMMFRKESRQIRRAQTEEFAAISRAFNRTLALKRQAERVLASSHFKMEKHLAHGLVA